MFRAELAAAGGRGPVENVRFALAAIGGIGAFVKPGERVVIKPNCAWDRTAEQAANTNPELIGELTRLCLAAGAASVMVVDNSCHDPGRSFVRSGIEAASRDAGAATAHQRNLDTVRMDLGGTVLGPWDVLEPIATADRVINVPIVKHHSLSRATLGMKNWFGAVVGRRPNLHQRIAQVCAELGAAFRPTLTVIDATRVFDRRRAHRRLTRTGQTRRPHRGRDRSGGRRRVGRGPARPDSGGPAAYRDRPAARARDL